MRQRIVDLAEDFAALARMAVNRRPKTPMDANLAILRNQEVGLSNQEKIIKLLSSIEVSVCFSFLRRVVIDVWQTKLTVQGREEKRKKMGKKTS